MVAKMSVVSKIVLLAAAFSCCSALMPPSPKIFSTRHSLANKQMELRDVRVSTPSSDSASEMGIREWPQQLKKGSWQENAQDGKDMVRYVLDGKGTLQVSDENSSNRKIPLSPGTLVEVSGDAVLSWDADDEMIILTPGFEEGGTLAIVAVGVIVLFGALLAGVGS